MPPLQKQSLDINLAVGMSTIEDPKVQKPGSNALVENGRFTKDGIIRKTPTMVTANTSSGSGVDDIFVHDGRLFSDSLATDNISGFAHSSGPATSKYDLPSNTVVQVDNPSTSRADGSWAPFSSVNVETVEGEGVNANRRYAARAEWNGYRMDTYQETSLYMHVAVTRLSDGVVVYEFETEALKSTVFAPGVDTAVQTELCAIYFDNVAGLFGIVSFDTADETVSTSENITVAPFASWAIDFSGLGVYWLALNGAVYDLTYAEYNEDTTTAVAPTVVIAGIALPKSTFTACRGPGQETHLGWQDSATSFPQYAQVVGITSVVGVTALGTGTATMGSMVAMRPSVKAGAVDNVHVLIEYTAITSPANLLSHFHLTGTTPTVLAKTDWYGATIAAKPFTADGVGYFVVASVDPVQRTIFVMGIEPNVSPNDVPEWSVFASFLTRRSGDRISPTIDDSVVSGDGLDMLKVCIGCSKQMRLVSDGEVVEQTAIAEIAIHGHGKTKKYVGGQLVSGGGYSAVFGQRYSPIGPLQFPQIGALAAVAGGSLAAGTYNYRVISEQTDSAGNIYRSAPSASVAVLAVLNDRVSVTVYPPFAYTREQLDDTTFRVFRTALGGSIYHDTTLSFSGSSYAGGPMVIQYDTLSDAALLDNEILYTEGGELENQAPPPMRIIEAAADRLWGWAADDPSTLVASKPKTSNIGLGFNDSLTKPIVAGGPGTGLAHMDGNLVLFKADRVLVMPATAPTRTGQGSFPQPTEISRSVGCVEPRSVLRVPSGVMFKSSRGLQLLDRSMQISYVGAAVEDYNTYTVDSSLYDEERSEALFLVTQYPTANVCALLIYNTLFGRWSVRNIADAAATLPETPVVVTKRLALFGGKLVTAAAGAIGGSDGLLFIDSATDYTEALSITTPWYSFGSIQGLKRVTRAIFMGEYASAHSINIEVYTDWDDSTVVQTMTFDASTGYSEGDLLTFNGHMSDQKARAYRFRVYDSVLAGTKEGYRPSTLTLQIGAKRGVGKLPASLRI